MSRWKPLDIPELIKSAHHPHDTKTQDKATEDFEAGYQAGVKAAGDPTKKQTEPTPSFIRHQIDFKQIHKRLADIQQRLALPLTEAAQGTITRSEALRLEAQGITAAIGDFCDVYLFDRSVSAVITGCKGDTSYLMC